MEETESKSNIVVHPSMAASLSLIKHLASCNKSTRDKSLRLLSKWLPTQLEVSDDDMKKLWKGLFYCVWHADKAPVQAELINRLASLLHILDLPLALQYFSVFLLTLRREWSGIDALRLDKFYLLIRRFVNSVFQLLNKNGWDLNLTTTVMGIVENQTFSANDAKILGNGVSYHIAAVFLDELKGFLPVNREAIEILFGNFLGVMSKSRDKVLISKITVNVFDVLLKTGRNLLEEKKKNSGDDVGDAEMENIGTIGLVMGFAAKFYDLGSSTECFQGNRKILFGLHKQFLKLEKDLEASGIVIEIPVVKPIDDDEVPQLIPIVTDKVQVVDSGLLLEAPEVVAEESVGKSSSKKNKKAKKGSSRGSKKLKVSGGIDNSDMIVDNGESLSTEPTNDGDSIDFSESFKSNLQMEFEKVAEEEGLDKEGDTTLYDSPAVTVKKVSKKKRKRVRSGDGDDLEKPIPNGHIDSTAKSGGEKSEKKVRFSIKNNLVWQPQSPLPPQSVRIPPSVTPRGSALKKGVPPGPIRQMPTAAKKAKAKKKARKVMKSASPGTKRQRKLQGFSA